MKKNVNVIQINGIRGLILAGMAVCCLFAGFVVFPGWLLMHLWNFGAGYFYSVPQIGIIQGVLLWAIIVGVYFTFRKNRMIVCLKSPQGLDESELKAIFEDIRERSKEEMIKNAMLKAHEVEKELKIQDKTDISITDKEPIEHTNSNSDKANLV